MKLLALCSGGGGTVQFIHKCLPLFETIYQANIELTVIADRKCRALDWALSTSFVAASVIDISNSQQSLVYELKSRKPDLVFTFVHRIVQPFVLDSSEAVFINTHYSLLPSFKGTIGSKTASQALSEGVKIIGATSHLVTNELDSGPILSQVALPLGEKISLEIIMPDLFYAGCITSYLAIRKFLLSNAVAPGLHTLLLNGSTFLISEPLSNQEISFIQATLGLFSR
jgi:phosphoribosylglycinamide formyltransferase-1